MEDAMRDALDRAVSPMVCPGGAVALTDDTRQSMRTSPGIRPSAVRTPTGLARYIPIARNRNLNAFAEQSFYMRISIHTPLQGCNGNSSGNRRKARNDRKCVRT